MADRLTPEREAEIRQPRTRRLDWAPQVYEEWDDERADLLAELDAVRAERDALLSPAPLPDERARSYARRRGPLGGADAQALEHAITITERERDAHAAGNRNATQVIVDAIGSVGPESVEDAAQRIVARVRELEERR